MIQEFIKYIPENIISSNYPPVEPFNGFRNDLIYLELEINLIDWNLIYKKLPRKRDLKKEKVKFTLLGEDLGYDDEERYDKEFVVSGKIRDYRLKEYGTSFILILKDLEIKYKLNVDEKLESL